jgi:capsular exopolysaccharide synthesis family protein
MLSSFRRQDSLDVFDYLGPLIRGKWLILACLAFFVGGAVLLSNGKMPVYTATAQLELTPYGPKVTKFEEFLENQFKTDEFLQTQMKLLQKPNLARRVIDKIDLEEHPIFNSSLDETEELGFFASVKRQAGIIKNKVKAAIKGLFAKNNSNTAKEDAQVSDPALDRLKKQKGLENFIINNLEVERSADTNIISVSFTSEDPALSRDVINALMEEFISWQMDLRIDAAKTAKQQLEKQINVARGQLKSSEEELNQFARQEGIVSLDTRMNLIYLQLQEINEALAEAEANRISKQELYKQTLKGDGSSLSVVLENELLKDLKNRYIELRSQYENLLTTFKKGYPRVKTVKAQMADIERNIELEKNKILGSLKEEYASALDVEKALQEVAEEKKLLALELNDKASSYKILEREVDINKQIYQSLLERSKEIDADVGTDIGNIKVIESASLPLKPDEMNTKRNVFLAMVFGLMVGVGLVLVREYFDNTIKRVDEISDRHMIPILGVVPLVKKSEQKDLEFACRVDPSAIFSEAIRISKTTIDLSSFAERPLKTMLLTSIAAKEGKSTISVNLAQEFALSDEKVLLIDADLRNPRLNQLFSGNGNGKGLRNYLAGACGLEEIIEKTEIANMYFISAGSNGSHASTTILDKNRMKKLLEVVGKNFDRVILDGPPFGSDILVLGNVVDGIVLIGTIGQTHREGLRIFLKNVSYVNGRVLGSIVNKVDISRYSVNHYCKHYHYRNYGE